MANSNGASRVDQLLGRSGSRTRMENQEENEDEASFTLLALVAGHSLSRACAVLMVWCLPYVRTDDSTRAKPVVESISPVDLLIAGVGGVIPLLALGVVAAGGLRLALLAFVLL